MKPCATPGLRPIQLVTWTLIAWFVHHNTTITVASQSQIYSTLFGSTVGVTKLNVYHRVVFELFDESSDTVQFLFLHLF